MDVEDLPVGQSSGEAAKNQFGSEFPDQQPSSNESSNKTMEEKLVSKKWNERASGYEELSEKLKQVSSAKDPLLYDQSEGFKKYLKDSNPGALEKAVDCFIEFVKKADSSILSELQAPLIDLLITKSVAHLKPSLQEKGIESIWGIIECTEDFEGVSLAVWKPIKGTNVKAAGAGVNTILHLVKWFGLTRFPLKDLLAQVATAFGSRNGAVRQAALCFYEECYKWIGEAIQPAVEKLNKPQQDELGKLFAKFKESGEGKPKATRKTKKEEENAKQAELDDIWAKEEEEEKMQAAALDLEEDKDALAKFDQEWSAATLGLKKWNEKKEKLEELNKEINTAKILPNSNKSAVLEVLSKFINDSNMNVYDEVVKAIGYLAQGLKKDFAEEAKMILGPMLAKIKKRPSIIQNVGETWEKMLNWLIIDDLIPILEVSLKDRSPIIVKQAAEFYQTVINQTYIDDLKKIYSGICPAFVKLASHQDGSLRTIGLQALGLLKGRLGADMEKFLGDFNQQKLEKITESAGEYQITKYDKPRVQKKPKAKKPKPEKANEGGDAVMTFDDAPKPKKKKKAGGPPSSFMKRQQEMQEKSANKFEELKAELNGEAPLPKAQNNAYPEEEEKIPGSSTSAMGSESTQPPKVVEKKEKVIVEDTGAGVAKEDATPIIEERVPANILKKFSEAKWQEKKEAYTLLANWFLEQEYSSETLEAWFWYFRIKLNDWKEKNVNIVKGALAALSSIITGSSGMSKKSGTMIIPFFSERIGDVKYKAVCQESLLNMTEIFGPSPVVKGMCKQASDAKAPNVIVENLSTISLIINDFGTAGLPIKEMMGLGVKWWDNKNPKVRNEAISMLSNLYKHLGDSVKTFLKDIKDSTLAVINKEFDKITPLGKGEFKSKRQVRNDDVAEEAAGAGDPLDCIPRTDVSKELGGQKLINLINDNAWKKRKEAVDKMNAVLEKANMRILPNGLSELVGLLKVKMADSNKSVSKGFLEFVGKFATALGPAAKQYAPMLIKPLFRCLSEKNTLVRKINLESIEKWAEAIGAENLIGSIGTIIAKDNPEIRSVLLDWILKNKDSVSKSELSGLPKPLISCLSDKAPAIRGMAENVIILVLPHLGPGVFNKIVKDLKQAVQNSVKPIVTKWIAEANLDVEMEDSAPAKGKSKKDEEEKSSKPLPAALAKARDPKKKSKNDRPKTAAPMTAQKIHEKLNKKPMAVGKKKATDDEGLMIFDIGKKDKRNELDKKKRWNPEEIRGDYVAKFKTQTSSIFGDSFTNELFSTDFKKHMKCIKKLKTAFENEDIHDSFLSVIDIVIKWAYIKSNEISNISFLKELLNFFEELVEFLLEKEYQFMEAEGTIFCLCLVEKIGINNNTMKEKLKSILMKVGNSTVFYPKKVMSILMKGLNSKNTKTTAECLACIAQMIQIHQVEVIHEKDVKNIAKQWESADNGIRQSALVAIEEIYKITQEQFWSLTGDKLSTKAKDIISARLNAHLGVPLNSTPVEEKNEKSPQVNRGMRSSNLNKSLNKSLNSKNKLNASFGGGKFGRNTNENSQSQLGSVQSSANFSKRGAEAMATPKRRKDSSVNRKLERMSSASRKNDDLEAKLEKEIDKIKNKAKDGEIVQEILLLEEDPSLELDENLDSIGKNIKQLKYGDLSGKVDALVIINEWITVKINETIDSLLRNSGFLIDSLSRVLYDVFNKTNDKIPLKFGKYFISILNKICSMKEIVRNVDEYKITVMVEQLLLKLLIPGLDDLGERNEGKAMFRNLNNTILKVLENCHPTDIFVVFLKLLKKYKGFKKIEKLNGIIVKCLLKVTRIMDQLIDKVNIGRILLVTHEYLSTEPTSSGPKSDDVGIRITKTIVNELVKLKKDQIWDHYEGVDAHSTPDLYIKKWIEIILVSLNGGTPLQRPSTAPPARENVEYTGGLSQEDNETLKGLIKETQWGNQFRSDQAWKSLLDFTNDFPNLDFDAYLRANWSNDEQNLILTGIMKAKKRRQINGSSAKNVHSQYKAPLGGRLQTPNKMGIAQSMKTDRQTTEAKLQEYQSRLKSNQTKPSQLSFKKHESENANKGGQPEFENGLKKSIAAMNSSITEKWRKINSKGLQSSSGLNNTIGGGFQRSALQEKPIGDEEPTNKEESEDAPNSTKTKMALQARLNEVKARLGQIKKTQVKR